MEPALNKTLSANCTALEGEFDQIPVRRQSQLKELGDYIFAKLKDGQPALLTVICTHNSRRSHIGQLWLKAAAIYYGVEKVETFSGGTEATAFNPRAVVAMQKAGFAFKKMDPSENPRFEASMGDGLPTLTLFSKKFSDGENPQKGFAAVLVCSDADEACPFVPGADARFAIPYDDPKNFDGTPTEVQAYDERCRQIGREMLYAMDHTKRQLELSNLKLLTIYPSLEENPRFAVHPDCGESLSMVLDFYKKVGFQPPWVCYYAERAGVLVGSCAFKGAPVDGRVEIAYGTFPKFQRQGIAGEMCRQLTALALATDPTLRITARTLPDINFSTRVLEKNGFILLGDVEDPEDGWVWEWVYQP